MSASQIVLYLFSIKNKVPVIAFSDEQLREENQMVSKSDKNTFLELALISAICFVLGFILFTNGTETQTQNEPIVEQFDDYPLIAWQTTDKDGRECVKVKYRVLKQ